MTRTDAATAWLGSAPEVRELRRILYAAVDPENGARTAQDVRDLIQGELNAMQAKEVTLVPQKNHWDAVEDAAEPTVTPGRHAGSVVHPGAASVATTPKEVVEPGGACPSEATVSTEPLSGRPPGSATSFGADDWATVDPTPDDDSLTPEQLREIAANWRDTTQLSNALDGAALQIERRRAADQAKTEALRDRTAELIEERRLHREKWDMWLSERGRALAAAAAAPGETR